MRNGFKIPSTLRIAISLIFLAGCAYVAMEMDARFQNDQLWGHLPLWLWIFGWGGLSLWLLGKRSASFYGLSTLAGFTLAFGFPPFPTTILMAIGFVPLLLVWANRKNRSDVFLFGLNTFMWWNLLATYWVCNTALVAGIVAIGLNSLLMAVTFWLFALLSSKVRPGYHFLLWVATWISFEYAHHYWDIQWPWLTLGNSLAEFPWLAQWYEYTGVFGGSLWIMAVNWNGYVLVRDYLRDRNLKLSKVVGYTAVLLVPIFISLLMLNRDFESKEPVTVAIVQPNFEPHYEKFEVSRRQAVDTFIHLSNEIVDAETDFLLYPETVFDVTLNRWSTEMPVREINMFLKLHPDIVLVSGFASRRILSPEEPADAYTRIYKMRSGDEIRWEGGNAAMRVMPDEFPQVYYKSKLVPGAEFFPFKKFLPFLGPLIRKLGGSYAGLIPQEERVAFYHTRDSAWAAGPIICYESVFGEYVSGYIEKGATMLFIMTNDGWWDDTPGHKQHLAYASLRAIEQRKPIARAANTGISGFIDIYGSIRNKTQYNEAIAVQDTIYPNSFRTVYSRTGDVIARFCVLLAGGFLLYSLATYLRRRAKIN